MENHFPLIYQKNTYDCGPACLAMLSMYYDIKVDYNTISKIAYTDFRGTSILNMCRACQELGLIAYPIKVCTNTICDDLVLPCIAQIENSKYKHYVVIYEIRTGTLIIANPSSGLKEISVSNFLKKFNGNLILIEKQT